MLIVFFWNGRNCFALLCFLSTSFIFEVISVLLILLMGVEGQKQLTKLEDKRQLKQKQKFLP
jgi:hypothetical protein